MINSEELLNFINKNLLSKPGVILDEDTPLFKNRYLDSVTILSLIGYIEKNIGRKLTDEEIFLDNFASVTNIVKTFKS